MRVTRRSMLSGLSAGTAAVIARPLVRECFAQAKAPQRLLFVWMPNCSIRANWLPTGGRMPALNMGDATQFTLKAGNATLAPAREQMTIITGLDLPNIGGCAHGSACIRLMSGGTIRAGEKAPDPGKGSLGAGNLPVLPTFDQVILGKVPAFQGTQIPSLQLGADTRADDGRTDIQLRVMSYDTQPMPTPLPPEIEPTKTYLRIFSSLMPATTTGDQKAALDKALAQQQSVLDFVKDDLARLEQRLPKPQQEKLDKHLDGLREIERSLSRSATYTAGMLPGPPPVVAPNVSANHQMIVNQSLAIIKLVLQFDISRVITFMFASGNSQVSMGDFLPGYAKGGLHPLAHKFAMGPLTQATTWYCQVMANYVMDLATSKEADGSSILDNTLISFFSEVGQFHEHNNIPFVLFGGKNLGHVGGRCLNYTGRTPSDVWLAVAHALNVQMPTFGDPQYNKGPLPELLATA